MDDDETLRRLHAAYMHLRRIADGHVTAPLSPVAYALDLLSSIYMHECTLQNKKPWDITPWEGPP